MTIEAFTDFSTCLIYLPSQQSIKWDDGAFRFYFTALRDIPDQDAEILAQLVAQTEKWRPAPAGILELWREKIEEPRQEDARVKSLYRAGSEPIDMMKMVTDEELYRDER